MHSPVPVDSSVIVMWDRHSVLGGRALLIGVDSVGVDVVISSEFSLGHVGEDVDSLLEGAGWVGVVSNDVLDGGLELVLSLSS